MDKWTIGDFVEELILLCEVSELPGIQEKIQTLKQEIKKRFNRNEILSAGIVL